MVTVKERETRSKNMYARVKDVNFQWIHQDAKRTKRSLSDYVDTLIDKLRAEGPAHRAATNGGGKKRTAKRALKSATRKARRAKRSKARH